MMTLITGGSGLLALNWALARADIDTVTLGLHKRQIMMDNITSYVLNYEHSRLLADQIAIIDPDAIIHTAALTSVEQCEHNHDLAMQVNCDLASTLAKIAHDQERRFVHISTDHLSKGITAMLDETAPCQPLNNYGRSKWAAEKAVQENYPDALILRVNFFGWGPSWRSSFSDWILSSLKAKTPITLYDNVFFTPLYVDEIVDATHALIETNATGLFNCTSGDRLSKYEFGLKLADVFELDQGLIRRGSYDPSNGIPRPLDMSLNNKKLMAKTCLETFTIDRSIARLKAHHNRKQALSSIDYPS